LFFSQPGDNVTIWCKHTSNIGKYIHWFKQKNCAVPLSIVYMMLPYELEVKATYLNGFQPDRLVMSLNSKNSSLRISNVEISDSGLYYCGWQNWVMTFGDGTQLDIKGNTFFSTSTISTRDCSENIFYKLTFIFGGIIFILIIILLTTLIIKRQDRSTQGKGNSTSIHFKRFTYIEPHSSVYAALQFSKHKSRRAARNTEDTDVVYSATR
uniref:Ig-like domain-containing protein n=1 Tax=Sinocyclocheilus rhinocerous TaxID=307959 RepID=A0A673HMV0_9TELE